MTSGVQVVCWTSFDKFRLNLRFVCLHVFTSLESSSAVVIFYFCLAIDLAASKFGCHTSLPVDTDGAGAADRV